VLLRRVPAGSPVLMRSANEEAIDVSRLVSWIFPLIERAPGAWQKLRFEVFAQRSSRESTPGDANSSLLANGLPLPRSGQPDCLNRESHQAATVSAFEVAIGKSFASGCVLSLRSSTTSVRWCFLRYRFQHSPGLQSFWEHLMQMRFSLSMRCDCSTSDFRRASTSASGR